MHTISCTVVLRFFSDLSIFFAFGVFLKVSVCVHVYVKDVIFQEKSNSVTN